MQIRKISSRPLSAQASTCDESIDSQHNERTDDGKHESHNESRVTDVIAPPSDAECVSDYAADYRTDNSK